MYMDAWDLYDAMGNILEAKVRKILIEEKLAKTEEVANMNRMDICKKFLEHYKVVSYDEAEDYITIVKLNDVDTYESITRVLSN